MKKTRIAIVGLGMAVTPHARSALDLADRVEVAYAYSPSAERRARFAEKFSFPQCDELEAILEDSSVDAIAVLTPPNTHFGIVKRCAEAGKHVLLEKPLEITTARAEEMVAECRARGVTLGVVLQHRHKPAVARLAELLRGEEIGALVGASAIIRLWRPQSYYDDPGRGTRARDGGGVLITQAIHSVWQDFLDAIERGGEPRVNGEEALRVHRLIDALLDSAAKGAAIHFSPAGMGTR